MADSEGSGTGLVRMARDGCVGRWISGQQSKEAGGVGLQSGYDATLYSAVF